MVEHLEHDPKRIESLRMQIDSLIQNYLNQKPIPGIADFAEVFGAESYVVEMKRQKAIKIDIKSFREEMVTRLLEQSESSGVEVILPKVFEMLSQTILPPDEGEIKTGSGEGVEKKKYIPRTQYLIDLLSEMGESYEIMGGKNTSDMMRERTYFIFFLPNSEKAVFVNNEEGNTTFIIYQVNSKQEAVDVAALTKDEIRAKELHSHPYVQIDWTGDEESWKGRLLDFLNLERPPEKIVSVSIEDENITQTSNADSKRNRTLESAVNELEGAYKLWKAQDEEKRGKFNINWLINHGFGGLYNWVQKRKIELKTLVNQASLELQKDFVQKLDRYTPELALSLLETAHQKWKSQDTETRDVFNIIWLQRNGYDSLYNWINGQKNLRILVEQTSLEFQKDFEKRTTDRTAESALVEFEVAHQKWKSQDPESRGKFNPDWLRENDYLGLYIWFRRNKNLHSLITNGSPELQKDFEKRDKDDSRTPESALAELKLAHQKWTSQDPESRGDFNQAWMERNSHTRVLSWIRHNYDIESFIKKSSSELQKDFKKTKVTSPRTPESALVEFEAAYQEWRMLPSEAGVNFNANWLKRNEKYKSLWKWADRYKKFTDLVAQSSPELQKDFSTKK